MNFTLGVYDLFTYAVPGSLYLALLTYIADRLSWVSAATILHSNTTLVIIAAAVASYLLGHATYQLGRALSHAYGRHKDPEDAAQEFANRVPAARGRAFLRANRGVLQAAVEVYASQSAVEIVRLRAISLMLRNSAPVFLLGALAAVAEAISDQRQVVAGCCAVVFLLAAIGCLTQSVNIGHWANMKTFELAYWVPDIDAYLPDDGIEEAGAELPPAPRMRTRRALSASHSKARPESAN